MGWVDSRTSAFMTASEGPDAPDTIAYAKRNLKPFNSVIQICPVCGKVDAYKDDGHNCFNEKQNQIAQEYYD